MRLPLVLVPVALVGCSMDADRSGSRADAARFDALSQAARVPLTDTTSVLGTWTWTASRGYGVFDGRTGWRFAFAPAPGLDDARIEVEPGRLRRVSNGYVGPWKPYRFVAAGVTPSGQTHYRMTGDAAGCGGVVLSSTALLDAGTPCDGPDDLYVRPAAR